MQKTCLNCTKILTTRDQIKFCSNKCQHDHTYLLHIGTWRDDSKKGINKIQTRNISKHIRRYIIEKYGYKCSLCGWNKKHPVSGVVPVEIDHIDGNPNNNVERNLRLLCPNCHSLTSSFRNLNHGKGRQWRIKKPK